MLVQISNKEQDRIKKAEQYFNKDLGLETEVCNLQYGDYIFNDKVVFEYKTIQDMISSIQDNRVFNETINQAENYDWHYLIIQGNEAERSKQIALTKHYQRVNLFQYLGCLASINRYTTVIEVYSNYINESFYRMYIQAKKDLSTKPIIKRHGRKDKNPAFNFLCNDVYGVSGKKAQEIVKAYNIHTLNDLLNLTLDDFTNINGIGENTGKKIMEALK